MIKLTDILNELDQETAYRFIEGGVQYDDTDGSLLAVDLSGWKRPRTWCIAALM